MASCEMQLFQAKHFILTLKPWREREVWTWEYERTKEMLSSVILHAMNIGMSRAVFGMLPETNEMTLKFWGPAPNHPVPQWWDMVPPPVECYPFVVKACLDYAKLDPSFPFKGEIECQRNRVPLILAFSMDSLTEFQLAWKLSD